MNAIEERARRYGVTLTSVCRRAGVPPSTVLRWKSGASPGIVLFEQVCGKLEDTLDAMRGDLEARLAADRAAADTAPRQETAA